MLKVISFLIIFACYSFANETNILRPSLNSVYDITTDRNSSMKVATEVARIQRQVQFLIGFYPRLKQTFKCSDNTCPFDKTKCICSQGEYSLNSKQCEWFIYRGKDPIYATDTQAIGWQTQTVYIQYSGCCATYPPGDSPPCNVAPGCTVNGPSGDVYSGCSGSDGNSYPYGRNYNSSCPGPTVWNCPDGWSNNGDGTCSRQIIVGYQCAGGWEDIGGMDCRQLQRGMPACPVGNYGCEVSSSNSERYCSPYKCLNGECGVAVCNSVQEATDGANNSGICKNLTCDINEPYNKYCGTRSCPQGFGVYQQNGNCYQDVCPPEANVGQNGQCVALKCPSGTIDDSQGGCQ